MPLHLCVTCGTQFPEAPAPPPVCPTCADDRQWVPAGGSRWTTLEALRAGHRNAWQRWEPGLFAIGTTPDFAIAQRALLVRTPAGNVLWDCIPLLDDATVELVQALGGLAAIAISHPHYYSTMVEWAHAFGVPVWLHAADRAWVARPDAALRFWEGDSAALLPGVTLVHCGGHFEGGAVLHWAQGAEGRGALLTGDVIQVAFDRRWVSFMRSYPNMVPLADAAVRRIARAVAPYPFERIYGAFADRHVLADAKAALARSVERYADALTRAGT